jgi:predicted nucleic acid-binding protein
LAAITTLDDVQLLTSTYALEEARRNLASDRPDALSRLSRLLAAITIVDAPKGLDLPKRVRLDSKDEPILLAAIHGKADYLLTGDLRHFAHLYGERIEGVLVLRPAEFFRRRTD